MLNIIKKLIKQPIIWIVITSIPVIWALFVPGFYGASDDLHIAWLYEMDKVIKIGQIPPRFVPDLSYGFGYPLFNFVFPLPFYIAEIFHLLSLSLVDSIKLVFIFSLPLSGILMFYLLKQFTGNLLSFTGAILYMYAPYRAVDIYIRGAIGEIVSFIFLPLIILSLTKLAKTFSLRWLGIGAIALACLILSHNITAYMFFPYILLLILVRLIFNPAGYVKFLTVIFSMVFLALGISSYFWLPAIYESKLMEYDTVFNFVDHFPTVKQLFTPYWGYGASVPGPYDGLSFFLGFLNIAVLGSGFVILPFSWKKIGKDDKIMITWTVVSIISAFFLMNYRSTFFWNTLPLLSYFQFPWRFLSMTTFFIPLLVITFKYLKLKDFIFFIVIVLIILTSWNYFRPQHFLGRTDMYYLNRYIPVPKASEEYRNIQEEYLRLPKGIQKKPEDNFPVVFPTDNFTFDLIKIHDLHFLVSLSSEKEILLNFNKYFFPGWQAKLNEKEISVKPGLPYGQVTIVVPPGKHKLEVFFAETPLRTMLNFISLISILFALILIWKNKLLMRR